MVAAGTAESVIKMVSQTERIAVSQTQVVEHRRSLVSQMQLVAQTDTACQAQMPSARPGRSANQLSSGRSGHPDPSGTQEDCVQSDTAGDSGYQAQAGMACVVRETAVLSATQEVSQSHTADLAAAG